jgi:hypothetical protein
MIGEKRKLQCISAATQAFAVFGRAGKPTGLYAQARRAEVPASGHDPSHKS